MQRHETDSLDLGSTPRHRSEMSGDSGSRFFRRSSKTISPSSALAPPAAARWQERAKLCDLVAAFFEPVMCHRGAADELLLF